MLIGQYLHTLDTKKRLSLPSKFRKELGATVVITRGLDSCLFVYSLKEWKRFTGQLSDLSVGSADSRAFLRFVLASAVETLVDKSGRILIPDFLKDFANLIDEKVIVTGVHNRIELWNESSWNTYNSRISLEADALAEKLSSVGMI